MGKDTEIKLEDFCVMEEFYHLLENWTKTTGISTTAVNVKGEQIAPAFGMAEYCSFIKSCEAGKCACQANFKSSQIGIYECHAGFFDFAIPIETPNGILLGRVLAGQVLTLDQPEENIIQKAQKYNLSETEVLKLVRKTKRRSREELESVYTLLKQMLDMFVEKSYQKWYEHKQLYDVVATAGVGLWRITMLEGEKPKLDCSDKMMELLGISDLDMTKEEQYEAWHSRVKESSLPSVEASVQEMMERKKSENIYIWNHPTLGERYVRCGGVGEKIGKKGFILSGYHSDITNVITKENKQKQLLSDALSETKRQKELLQEALDNYKQADYDRRTDFLTGLKNRQDMYEILNDELSGIHEKVKAVFMLDVDNFKMYNDNYGHLAGDECLKRIGSALIEYEKKNNILFFRYGGEEIMGLSLASEKSPNQIADELVKLVADLKIERSDVTSGIVTISLGYSTDITDTKKMIDKADAAMYEAKSRGKNQCVSFESYNLI